MRFMFNSIHCTNTFIGIELSCLFTLTAVLGEMRVAAFFNMFKNNLDAFVKDLRCNCKNTENIHAQCCFFF